MTRAVHSGVEDQGSDAIAARLGAVWRRERLRRHLGGACTLLLWIIALLLVDWFLDWSLVLPPVARATLLVVNLAILITVVWRRWWRQLEAFDARRIALRIEARHPGLRNLLISYVQAGELGEAAASPALLRAMQRQAVATVEPLDFRGIVDFRELRRVAATTAVLVAVFALCSVGWSEHFRVLVQRLLDPGSQLAYPTRTRILATSGDLVARAGDPVELQAQADGLVPHRASLEIRSGEGAWEELELRGDGDRFVHVIARAAVDGRYRFRIGDARSAEHRITVVPPPRLLASSLTVHHPAYTGRGERRSERLDGEALSGSTLAWQLRFAEPVRGVELLLGEGEAQAMRLSEGGLVASLERRLDGDLHYGFAWTETSHGYRYPEGVEHRIAAIPDLPPEVRILEPRSDLKATTAKRLDIAFRAVDDIGFGAARLVYVINGGRSHALPIAGFAGRPQEQARWDLAGIADLQAGDVVTWHLEVEDNRQPEAQTARSREHSLSIISVDAYRQLVVETLRVVGDDLQAVAEEERAARAVLGVLRGGSGAGSVDEEPQP